MDDKQQASTPAAKAVSDKKTIGVTKANESRLAQLVSAGHFGSELEAAKFAMAHAISLGAKPAAAEGASTKWNVGTVDGDGALKALIETLYGQSKEPYRLVEQLINEGLRLLDAGNSLPPDVPGILFKSEPAK